MSMADKLKGRPRRFKLHNGITMDIEITKTDLKTIVSKNTRDNKFNAIKNALARNLVGYLHKAQYIGMRTTHDGKHQETAYFAYFSRALGAKTILCVRKMNDSKYFKPYAMIDNRTYKSNKENARTTK